jgi:hypothetical protein
MRNILGLSIVFILLNACELENKQFTKLSSSFTKIYFKNKLYETNSRNYFTNPYMYLGAGVAAGDFNNDGLEDLFFLGNMVPNKLYINKGDLKFNDISESAGIEGDDRWYSGVTLIDINNDGFLDIYCSVGGEDGPNNNVLYINNKDNTFTEKAREFGIDDDAYSMHSTFFDYDKDGDLDLYVANYPPTSFTAPVDYYKYRIENHKKIDSDHLYRNEGDFFVDVTKESGISNFGLSLGIVASDFNNDGYPDIYISNDFSSPDFMYINNRDGTFTNDILNTLQQTSLFGMGVDASDFNNDGWVDIFQLDMNAADNFRSKANMSSMNPQVFYQSVALGLHHQYMQNSLQANQGNLFNDSPSFSNISRWSGVSSTDWSWGGLFADFDNDGWKDLYVTNGIRRDVNNKDFYNENRVFFNKMKNDPNYKNKEEEFKLLSYLEKMPSEKLNNYLFQNQQDQGFVNKNIEWGLDEKTFSNGLVYSDLDNDGDLDLVVNNLEDLASIYRNNSISTNFIGFELKGKNNQIPIGARVHLKVNGQYQMQELNLSRGYLSSVSPRIHFGIGTSTQIDEIMVEWTDGTHSKIEESKVNTYNVIAYNDQVKFKKESKSENIVKRFETIIQKEPFNHDENRYNDFKDEVLLPHKNSTLGPALAVGDLNNDKLEDYLVGGAIGQPTALYIQQKNGAFTKVKVPVFEENKIHEDLGIQIFDADNDGDQDIYIASGGNEFDEGSKSYEDRFYENKGNLVFDRNKKAIPSISISGLEVSVNDFDQDGDLDLFVGGRLSPKKYPYPASSIILENQSSEGLIKFVNVTDKKLIKLKDIGLVTTSKWVDIDGDSWEDLILAGEWMSVRFFKNNLGKNFTEVTDQVFKTDYHGWWYDMEKGDFDNDGDIDLVLGNLGLNYKYQASEEKPFRIYLNDFDKNSTYDIVLSYKSDDTEYPVRGRQCSSQQMPSIKEKFKNYNTFASASLEEIYSEKILEESLKYEITSFESIYLENNDGVFIAKKLPYHAQLSNINSIVVEDVDSDGNLDALIGGNLFNSEVETPRNDASYGLWLKGDGKGGFRTQLPRESGLVIRGDVRNMKTIQVGQETHLIIAKNDEALQQIKIN